MNALNISLMLKKEGGKMARAKNLAKTKHHSKKALLILDMLNTFDFPEAEDLLPKAKKIARSIAQYKKKCHQKNIPVIYVNDNFGHWKSNWKELYQQCSSETATGKDIAKVLRPDKEDYFVLKPMHSGFFQTPLELLLRELEVEELVITGIAGNICVLFTAHDAHMRKFKVHVPKNCIASNRASDDRYVLEQFKTVLGFNISAVE